MTYRLIIRSREDEPVYARPLAAQLAQSSIEFLSRCEHEGWLQVRLMARGGQGYSLSDIRFLRRLCSIREHIDIDELPASSQRELAQQLVDLLAEVEAMERRMRQREQELLDEIHRLRRRVAEQRPQRW